MWTVQNSQNSLLERSEPVKQHSGSSRTVKTAFWTIENREKQLCGSLRTIKPAVCAVQNEDNSLVDRSEPCKCPLILNGQIRTHCGPFRTALWGVENQQNSLLDRSEPLLSKTSFWAVQNRQSSLLV